MARPEKVRLGEILVQQKLLSEEQLGLALAEQKRSGRKLGRLFIESGYVTEEQIMAAPIIAHPLGLFDCCGVSDGSACAIVTTPEIAPDVSSAWSVYTILVENRDAVRAALAAERIAP